MTVMAFYKEETRKTAAPTVKRSLF